MAPKGGENSIYSTHKLFLNEKFPINYYVEGPLMLSTALKKYTHKRLITLFLLKKLKKLSLQPQNIDTSNGVKFFLFPPDSKLERKH